MATPTSTPSEALPAQPPSPPETKEGLRAKIGNRIDAYLNRRRERAAERAALAHDAARTRVETVSTTRDRLASIRPGAEESADEKAKDASTEKPAATPEVETWNPTTWSPETRDRAAKIAVIGTGVVAGMLAVKWLWDRSKKTVNKIGEKMAPVWSAIKFGTVAAVLTGIGYVGYRGFEKYNEKINKIHAIEKRLQDAVEAAKNATGDAKAQMDKEVEKLKNMLLLAKKGEALPTDEVASAPASTTPEAPKDVDTSAEQKNTEKKDAEITPEERENLNKAQNSILAGAIVEFYENPKWTIGKDAKITQISDMINGNMTATMSDVFACAQRSGEALDIKVKPPIVMLSDDIASRTFGAEMMITFCIEHRERVENALMTKDNISRAEAKTKIESMSLQTFMDSIGSSYSVVPKLVESIAKAHGDPAEAIRNLKDEFLSDNAALSDAAKNFVIDNLDLTEEELKKIDISKLLKLIAQEISYKGSVRQRLGSAASGADSSLEKKAFTTILEKLNAPDDDTAKYMLPCFQGIFPNEAQSGQEQYIRTYLLDRMPVSQAMRFFLYKQMIKDGNPSGLVMMQVEVLKLISDSDMTFLGYEKNKAIVNIVENTLGKGTDALVEEWKKYGLTVSPDVIEMAKDSLGIAFKTGASALLNYEREKYGTMLALIQKHPYVAGALATLPAYKITHFLGKAGTYIKVNKARRFIALTGLNGVEVQRLTEPSIMPWLIRKIPIIGNFHEYAAARDVLSLIKDKNFLKNNADLMKKIQDPLKRVAVIKELRKFGQGAGDLVTIGATAEDLIKAGYTAEEVLKAGSTLTDVVKAGAKIEELIKLGYSVDTLVFAGAKLDDLIKAGAKIEELLKAGCTLNQVVKAGGDIKTLINLGHSVGDLIKEGAKLEDLIRAGVKAQELLKVSGVTARQVQQANTAVRLAKVGRVAKGTVVLDAALLGLDAYIYVKSRPEILKEMNKTSDPLKKDQLWWELRSQEMGMGFTSTGIALAFTPLAPVGIAMVATNAVAQPLRESINDGTTYMLTTENELIQYSGGKILDHISKSNPLDNVSWGQAAASLGMSETFKDANAYQRAQGYSAYFRQNALWTLPPLTIGDLSQDDLKFNTADQKERLKVRSEDELGIYAISALMYLQNETKNTFVSVGPDVLRQAEVYAKKRTLEMRRKSTLDPDGPPEEVISKTWDEKKAETQKDTVELESFQIKDLADLSNHPKEFKENAPWKILQILQHDLSQAELRILQTDYSNMGSWAAWSSWENEASLQGVARGVLSERVVTTITTLIENVQNGMELTERDIRSIVGSIRTQISTGNLDEIALGKMGAIDLKHLRTVGQSDNRLSIAGILDLLQTT